MSTREAPAPNEAKDSGEIWGACLYEVGEHKRCVNTSHADCDHRQGIFHPDVDCDTLERRDR